MNHDYRCLRSIRQVYTASNRTFGHMPDKAADNTRIQHTISMIGDALKHIK